MAVEVMMMVVMVMMVVVTVMTEMMSREVVVVLYPDVTGGSGASTNTPHCGRHIRK